MKLYANLAKILCLWALTVVVGANAAWARDPQPVPVLGRRSIAPPKYDLKGFVYGKNGGTMLLDSRTRVTLVRRRNGSEYLRSTGPLGEPHVREAEAAAASMREARASLAPILAAQASTSATEKARILGNVDYQIHMRDKIAAAVKERVEGKSDRGTGSQSKTREKQP